VGDHNAVVHPEMNRIIDIKSALIKSPYFG